MGMGGKVSSAYNNGNTDASYLYEGAYESGSRIKITKVSRYSDNYLRFQ